MFPHNMTLDEVSEIVREHNASLDMNVFIRADRDDHVIFNYMLNFEGVFPDLPAEIGSDEWRRAAILRECRGLIFDADTGLVIARRYTKFWNLNQRPEVLAGNIDFTVPHTIMNKLDGSMITPFRTSRSGDLRWGTKMGVTEVAEPVSEHVSNNVHYNDLANACIEQGLTPIFEWCSRQQRIVIDYPVDQLVLTHVRHNVTGEYHSRNEIQELADTYGVPVVSVIEATINNIDWFVEHTRSLKNLEGYVIHFQDDSHHQHDLMLKIKADEYCMLHNSKEKLNLEKNAIAMILSDEIDDLLPQLDAGDREALTAFSNDVHAGMAAVASMCESIRDQLLNKIDADVDNRERKKQYAKGVMEYSTSVECDDGIRPFIKNLLFRGYDETSLMPEIKKLVLAGTGTQTRVDEARVLIGGVSWRNYRGYFDAEE